MPIKREHIKYDGNGSSPTIHSTRVRTPEHELGNKPPKIFYNNSYESVLKRDFGNQDPRHH